MARRRQRARRCSVHEYLAETQARYRRSLERVERSIDPPYRRRRRRACSGKLMTIPVVVHVVYRRDAENISAAQSEEPDRAC